MMPSPDDKRVVLGRIVDAWGVRGWVKVEPFNDSADSALLHAVSWHLDRAALPGRAPISTWIEVVRARRHASTVVARLSGVDDREAAESLKGVEVGVLRAQFPPAGPDEWYWIDLIGCEVTNLGAVSLGTVVSVDDHGAHPLLATDRGHLIPFVDAYVREVSPQAGQIRVDWDDTWSL